MKLFFLHRRSFHLFLQLVFKINAGAGEGAADADLFHELERMQIDFLQDVEVFHMLARLGIAGNAHVKAAVIVVDEVDAHVAFVDNIKVFEIGLHLENKFLKLRCRCVIGQAEREINAAAFAQRVVGNRRVAQKGIGDIDQLLREGTDTGAAEGNAFDDAFDAVGLHPVANFKGLVEQDNHTAEDVGEGVLGCESNSEGADTERSDEGADVIVPFAGYGDEGQHNNNHAEDGCHDIGDGFVGLDTKLGQQVEEDAMRCINEVIQAPKEVCNDNCAQNAVRKAEVVLRCERGQVNC